MENEVRSRIPRGSGSDYEAKRQAAYDVGRQAGYDAVSEYRDDAARESGVSAFVSGSVKACRVIFDITLTEDRDYAAAYVSAYIDGILDGGS